MKRLVRILMGIALVALVSGVGSVATAFDCTQSSGTVYGNTVGTHSDGPTDDMGVFETFPLSLTPASSVWNGATEAVNSAADSSGHGSGTGDGGTCNGAVVLHGRGAFDNATPANNCVDGSVSAAGGTVDDGVWVGPNATDPNVGTGSSADAQGQCG